MSPTGKSHSWHVHRIMQFSWQELHVGNQSEHTQKKFFKYPNCQGNVNNTKTTLRIIGPPTGGFTLCIWDCIILRERNDCAKLSGPKCYVVFILGIINSSFCAWLLLTWNSSQHMKTLFSKTGQQTYSPHIPKSLQIFTKFTNSNISNYAWKTSKKHTTHTTNSPRVFVNPYAPIPSASGLGEG